MFRGVGAGIIVAVALTLTACVGDDPAASPTPTWSEAEAYAAAEETYRAYVDALNQVDLADPATFESVYALTTGDLNASDRESLSQYAAEGALVTGESVIASVHPSDAKLVPLEVTLDVCLDVSAVEVIDAGGNSLVQDDRVDVQSLRVIVLAEDSDADLTVGSITGREGAPECS